MCINKAIKVTTALGLLLLIPANGISCGPDFPAILTNHRHAALTETPPALFAQQIRKLAPKPQNAFKAVETATYEYQASNPREAIEQQGLSPELAAQIKEMRKQTDGDKAYAIGKDLPEEIRLYTAAAVDFKQAAADEKLEQAKQRFSAILNLKNNQNRAVWAAYMLGKIAYYQNQAQQVSQFYQTTRQLVISGYPDPLGLAVASFGEQARFHVESDELIPAIELYLQQLSYDSKSAEDSLRIIANQIIDQPTLLTQALANPLGQRLLFAHLYTKDIAIPFTSLISSESEINNQHLAIDISDPQNKDSFSSSNSELLLWQKIITSIEDQGIDNIAGTDWLAAAAYNKGQFNLAQRLVKVSQSPLSFWIKAKLALRDGDQTSALNAYAEAVKAFPVENQQASNSFLAEVQIYDSALIRYRINTERGILKLARSEYMEALSYLYAGANLFWTDAAYVAENVLTIDELKSFVDQNVNTGKSAIRDLLARRLMRAGRYDEALAYFDNQDFKNLAKTYRDNLQKTKDWWRSDTNKAQALYEAATIARFNGMELMGYELDPDYSVFEGNYSGWYSNDNVADQSNNMISADEQQRIKTHQANPNMRFHYRLIASNLAVKAADLLPHSSQAFAAVLCDATKWLLVREPNYAAPIYQRYLQQGPYVSWGAKFGQECPAPNFADAEKRHWLERFSAINQPIYRYSAALFLLFSLLILMLRKHLVAK